MVTFFCQKNIQRELSLHFFFIATFSLFIYSASPVVVWLEKQGVGIYWNSFQIFANKLGLPTVCAAVLDPSQYYIIVHVRKTGNLQMPLKFLCLQFSAESGRCEDCPHPHPP